MKIEMGNKYITRNDKEVATYHHIKRGDIVLVAFNEDSEKNIRVFSHYEGGLVYVLSHISTDGNVETSAWKYCELYKG